MPVVSFEGSDLTGKTSTISELSERLGSGFGVNRGPVHENELISTCIEKSHEANDKEREFLYTVAYVADSKEFDTRDNEDLILQDRYWPSVITYGRFLNEEDSLYSGGNYPKECFREPELVFHLTCSVDERLRRDRERAAGSRSDIDEQVLASRDEMKRMDDEVQKALEGLNTYQIDTTYRSIDEVALEAERALERQGLLDYDEV